MLPFVLLMCGLVGIVRGATSITPTRPWPPPFSKKPRTRLPLSYTGTGCSPSCTVSAENAQTYVWVPKVVTFQETITAATRIIIINKTDDTTTTSMKFNDLPDGLTLPAELNAAGTHTGTFSYTRNGERQVTELAFPTPHVVWPDNYQWSGTLETSGTCRTVSLEFSTVTLPSSPQLPLPPIPTHPQAGLDPEGLWYDLKHYDGIIHDFYDAFPSELAFQYCSWNGSEKLPGGVYFGPKFVFDESTSINGPTDTPTPVSAVGKMTTEPPETPSTQTPLPVTSAIPIGSQSINFSANPSATIAILPNGQTVEAGHTISVEGTPIFLPPSGTAIIVGSATVALNPAQPTQPPSITIGTKVAPVSFALGQTGVLLPNSGTLLPGSTTYIDGTTFSLDSSGTAIIADGTSIPLSGTAVPFPPVTAPGGIILPGDTTLLPGSSTVVSGTTYSADPTGVLVVNIGTSVMTVTPGEGTDSATGTATMGEGVWSGMGGGPRSKTAAAVGMHGLLHIWVGVAVIGARVLTIVL